MAFKVLCRCLRQPRQLVGPVNKIRLCKRARLSNTRRLAVSIHAGAADHGADGVAISQGVREALDDKRPDTFAAAVAVGTVIEGVRDALGAQHVH